VVLFDELPTFSVADLASAPDGAWVQVVGHVKPLDEILQTPFHETRCVAADVVGATSHWKPQSALDLLKGSDPHVPDYYPFASVFATSRGVSFVLCDPPTSYLVESPGERLSHIVSKDGSTVRVILPSAARQWGRSAELACGTWFGHKQSEHDMRFDAAHGGVLLGSKWEINFPKAVLLSPGRTAPYAHAFWNAHISTWEARVERWNNTVHQGDAPCWLRKTKVTERTLREGDSCCVIGRVRRTATGVELHDDECGRLLITNSHGAAKLLPPRGALPSGEDGSRGRAGGPTLLPAL